MPEILINKPNLTDQLAPKPIYSGVKKYLKIAGILILLITLVFILIAPLEFYLKVYSLFTPHALTIENKSISWNQLQNELSIVKFDKNLRTRRQKLDKAIDNALELEILHQAVSTPPASTSAVLDLFTEHKILREQIKQEFINNRTGVYFIARFTVPEATESAQELKEIANKEITNLKNKLIKGEDLQNLLDEADKNKELMNLNKGAFPIGEYLTNITTEQFPIKISSLRDKFFDLKVGETSDIIILSWNDYFGPKYGEEFTGDFGYAVAKIETLEGGSFQSFDEWLKDKKLKLNFRSDVPIPFYFNLY